MSGEEYVLSDSEQGTFNAAGTCTVFIAPDATEKWDITAYSVSTNDPVTSTTLPTAVASWGSFSEGTYSGNLDTSNTPVHLEKGQRLTVVWSGGTAGRLAFLNVLGRRIKY